MAFRLVQSSPFQNELVDVLCRYAVSLEQANLNVAFLMLWALLEKVTNTIAKAMTRQ